MQSQHKHAAARWGMALCANAGMAGSCSVHSACHTSRQCQLGLLQPVSYSPSGTTVSTMVRLQSHLPLAEYSGYIPGPRHQ